jgi:hypothetical protein
MRGDAHGTAPYRLIWINGRAGDDAYKALVVSHSKGVFQIMISLAFSIEQLRAAPPEVRRWIEREITAAIAGLNRSEHDLSQVHAAALAACCRKRRRSSSK